MKKLTAIIVGGTGQFGIVTSKFLLKKNYKITITSRSASKFKKKFFEKNKNLSFNKLDIYDEKKIESLLLRIKPNIVFYYAAQSSVAKSFLKKKETYRSIVVGCKNFLKIIKKSKLNCKFVNAASSEIYGKIKHKISVDTKKKPISPYGYSKLKSFEITKLYRKKYNLPTYNAVIFNTESIFRDKSYLIPKICHAAINSKKYNKKTKFGNINISREWNWCDEQVKYLLKFISKEPQDFILSNGKSYSAVQMLKFAFSYFNLNYKNYILLNSKKYLRSVEIAKNKSNAKKCLKRNKINRTNKIFGEKIIIKLIKYYLKNKKI